MAVYHIVLFKLKKGVTPGQLEEWRKATTSMVGKIPGLIRLDTNPPLPVSAHRAQSYDMGLVAVLEKPETVTVYAEHPEHLKVHKFREELCTETLAYDLEFNP